MRPNQMHCFPTPCLGLHQRLGYGCTGVLTKQFRNDIQEGRLTICSVSTENEEALLINPSRHCVAYCSTDIINQTLVSLKDLIQNLRNWSQLAVALKFTALCLRAACLMRAIGLPVLRSSHVFPAAKTIGSVSKARALSTLGLSLKGQRSEV